jgi:cyclophilin family peptidyl-prolyl cis-trans isomerase
MIQNRIINQLSKIIKFYRAMNKSFIVKIMFIGILSFGLSNREAKSQPKPEIERIVLISTSYGDMKIKLYNETPKHRDNFVKLVKQGYFDGTLFHRVIKGFMIQGGDPDSREAKPGQALGMGGPNYTIPAEFNHKYFHKKGALAAARQGDQTNPKKESSGSQFYIVQGKKYTQSEIVAQGAEMTPEQRKAYTTIGGTPFLDNNYTVFGEVIEGLDVIDKIAAVKTAPGDRPVEDVKVTAKMIN